VCVPRASTVAASPHVARLTSCNPNLGSAFGMTPITWTTATPCDDGVDNDGDGATDQADRGCFDALGGTESPRCQNGRDDDGDGRIDFDGGASAVDGAPLAAPDGKCRHAYLDSESGAGCGLGAEISLILLLLGRRRPARPPSRPPPVPA
jgi:hypothetical protein